MPSATPTAAVTATQFRSQIRSDEQWSRNAPHSVGWLSTIEQTLNRSINSVHRARELTRQAATRGASSTEAAYAMAAEVTQIREELVGLANTRYLDRPVFGGPTHGPVAYDANGVYQGNLQQPVDQTGPEVFGPNGANLFTTLANIARHMTIGKTLALHVDLTELDTGMERLQSRLAHLTAEDTRVETMQKAPEDRVLKLMSLLSGIDEVDLPKAIVDLQMQQVAYEAALGATRRVITRSLADFLR